MSHVVMKKTLAQALMKEAMVDHPGPQGQQQPGAAPQSPQQPQKFGFGGLVGAILDPIIGDTGASTYQAAPPPIVKQDFLPQIAEQQKRQSDVYSQQQSLAQALLNQSQGGGPNPALMQLQMATGQNAQQQSALMASQRGASANPALLARQAAMQGGAIQQAGVGQASLMQAQQQLAAQQALAQQQQAMAGNALGAEGIQQTGQANQNQSITGGHTAAEQVNAGISQGNANRDSALLGGLIQAGGGALAASKGGSVPGQAPVQGDSETNDVVPALLSPGEVVLPRTVLQGPDMEKKVLAFLAEIKGKKGVKKMGYGGVVESKKRKC